MRRQLRTGAINVGTSLHVFHLEDISSSLQDARYADGIAVLC